MKRMLLQVVFITYIIFVVVGTIFSRAPGEPFRMRLNVVSGVRLLIDGSFSTQIEILSNIILFIPFGMFLPLILGKGYAISRKATISILAAVFFTLTIELIQFVTGKGLFETADIASNLFGAVIGFILFILMQAITQKARKIITK